MNLLIEHREPAEVVWINPTLKVVLLKEFSIPNARQGLKCRPEGNLRTTA